MLWLGLQCTPARKIFFVGITPRRYYAAPMFKNMADDGMLGNMEAQNLPAPQARGQMKAMSYSPPSKSAAATAPRAPSAGSSGPTRPAPVVRKYFPETWLWRTSRAEYVLRIRFVSTTIFNIHSYSYRIVSGRLPSPFLCSLRSGSHF